jgi:multidrug transporter EmrE-like cation transporter
MLASLLLIALIVVLETCAMTCLKRGATDWRWFVGGIGFYALVSLALVQTFKLEGLAMTNALWSAMSVMATTSVGVIVFKEAFHAHDYLAIAMIGAGVMILKYTR